MSFPPLVFNELNFIPNIITNLIINLSETIWISGLIVGLQSLFLPGLSVQEYIQTMLLQTESSPFSIKHNSGNRYVCFVFS